MSSNIRICPTCSGDGLVPDEEDHSLDVACPDCDGEGYLDEGADRDDDEYEIQG